MRFYHGAPRIPYGHWIEENIEGNLAKRLQLEYTNALPKHRINN